MDFVKIFKNSCLKDTIKKVKKQPMEWGKTLIDHVTSKGLVFRIKKELLCALLH